MTRHVNKVPFLSFPSYSSQLPQGSGFANANAEGHPVPANNFNEDSERGDGSLQLLSQSRNYQPKLNNALQSSNASSMHYKRSASPGLQPVLHKKESHPSSTETSMSGGHASFAAALRKLAKQAKPVLPSTSSPPPAENRSKSASPVVSAVNSGINILFLCVHEIVILKWQSIHVYM